MFSRSRISRRSSRFLPTLEGMPRRITPGDVGGIPTFDSGYLDLDFKVDGGGTPVQGTIDGTIDGSGYLTLTVPSYSC